MTGIFVLVWDTYRTTREAHRNPHAPDDFIFLEGFNNPSVIYWQLRWRLMYSRTREFCHPISRLLCVHKVKYVQTYIYTYETKSSHWMPCIKGLYSNHFPQYNWKNKLEDKYRIFPVTKSRREEECFCCWRSLNSYFYCSLGRRFFIYILGLLRH